jgi:predicted RNA-binding Zn-ribbon protein involved in translation (DUF1610 family)
MDFDEKMRTLQGTFLTGLSSTVIASVSLPFVFGAGTVAVLCAVGAGMITSAASGMALVRQRCPECGKYFLGSPLNADHEKQDNLLSNECHSCGHNVRQ